MGLFDSKYCDICGAKLGLLGGKKLADGAICKDCANKLSPLFHERKLSTVEMIREQIEYREANKVAVEEFNVTQMYGKKKFLFIDEEHGNFMVNYRKSYQFDNPDVISLSQIIGLDIDVKDHRTEKKRKNAEGKEESFVPPHYETSFDVTLTINVKSPWFDEITIETSDDITVPSIGHEPVDPSYDVHFLEAMQLAEEMKAALQAR